MSTSTNIVALLFALGACSWIPHATCHYYRLETRSSFVVGSWSFTRLQSALFLVMYVALALSNLSAIVFPDARVIVAMISGAGHAALGLVHVVRLIRPFQFEVFGYPWSRGSSAREATMELTLGVAFAVVAVGV